MNEQRLKEHFGGILAEELKKLFTEAPSAVSKPKQEYRKAEKDPAKKGKLNVKWDDKRMEWPKSYFKPDNSRSAISGFSEEAISESNDDFSDHHKSLKSKGWKYKGKESSSNVDEYEHPSHGILRLNHTTGTFKHFHDTGNKKGDQKDLIAYMKKFD